MKIEAQRRMMLYVPKSSDIFRLANQMRKENVDVVGDKPVKNDAGEMSMSEKAKQNAWAEHYTRLPLPKKQASGEHCR